LAADYDVVEILGELPVIYQKITSRLTAEYLPLLLVFGNI